eukprot:TRINITY_DN2654_c0_g1_i2.p1 TRINITY_DN2654_c0_g1~~TRINITY_DN2654_c0_g1_i2.p1  ORF type:complete len:106 (+),score=0.76 TRINITY_DN2654_c0_g1_i2:204-521(+)
MADYYHGYGTYGGDRKLEIVNGRAFSTNQKYITRARSPDPPPIPSRVKVKNTSSVKPWSFNDPEMKRRKRVAGYKVYAVEGKVKASFRKGFRWIKEKCSELVHGW